MADEVADAERILSEAGIPTARHDVEWIAAAVLGERRSGVLADPARMLADGEAELFGEMIARRVKREPLAYVIGTAVFRGLELEVGPGVLVPRPESETTAARAIQLLRGSPTRPTVVDVGTGSCAIALSIAAEVPHARIFATEASGPARGWALRNLARTGLRCTLLPGDLLSPLHPALGGNVDVVVSNPPYVTEAAWGDLEPEVRFEPREAVVAGPTGVEVIAALVEHARPWLAPGGWLIVEIGETQERVACDLFARAGYAAVTVTPDLAGRPRVVEARWMGGL